MDSALLTALSVPAVVLINQCFNSLRDRRKSKRADFAEVQRVAAAERQRAWDKEDRKEQEDRLARNAIAHTGQVLGAIAQNTQVSERAFNTANDYNAKIAINTSEIVLLHARMHRMEADIAAIRETLNERAS